MGVSRTAPGRGAWVCADTPVCLERAARRGVLERAFRRPLAPNATGALGTATASQGAARPPPESGLLSR